MSVLNPETGEILDLDRAAAEPRRPGRAAGHPKTARPGLTAKQDRVSPTTQKGIR